MPLPVNSSGSAAAYTGLLAPLGFAILLGVVLVDLIIDFCPETAWRETYYAAHRTAPFPQRAFVPSAMALAVVGYARNVSYGRKASSGLLARDWRNVASGVLGVGIAIVTHHLVKRQDWVAQVAVENKARVRLAPQVLRALAEIRRGHVAIALALMLLVALQMSVAVDQVVEARLLAIHENGRAGSPPKSRTAKKL